MLRLKTREELEKEEATNSAEYEARLARSDVVGLSRAERRARARVIMKQQRRVHVERRNEQAAQGEADAQQQVLPAAQPEGQDGEVVVPIGAGLSRKERQKLAKATEKEERKIMQEERQKHQQEVESTAQEERRERHKRQMVELENGRLRQRRLKEEMEQKLDLERNTFLSTGNYTLMVQDWIKDLQSRRSVSIDEMADRFQVSSECVLSRIQELVEQERVTGVITSGGRFLYLSEDELTEVVQRVQSKGVASSSGIAAICNAFVLGASDPADVHLQ